MANPTINPRRVARLAGLVAACALTAGLAAQSARGADAGDQVVIGCVRTAAPSVFTITDTRPKPPVTYRLEASADQLEWHVGHTLEVEGPVSAGASGASMPTLKVKAIRYISRSCSN